MPEIIDSNSPRDDQSKAVISVRGVSKHFRRQQTLANVSFDIAHGEMLVILGPSGGGKTQFRVEGFNIFNRANFLIPGTTLGTDTFGRITGTEDPRQVQLAVRLYF